MGTILGSTIIDKAELILLDTTNVRWTEAELLGWLNDAQREVTLLKPDTNVTTAEYPLIAGTKQTIPDGTSSYQNSDSATLDAGIVLIGVKRNMGTNGTTPGRAITIIDMRIMDTNNPDWHSDTEAAETIHYMFDIKNPKVFYVTPPQPASAFGYVEVAYSSIPADLAAASSAITLDDIYSNVLLDYVLYRAYQKDADYAKDNARVQGYYSSFMGALGFVDKKELAEAPRAERV